MNSRPSNGLATALAVALLVPVSAARAAEAGPASASRDGDPVTLLVARSGDGEAKGTRQGDGQGQRGGSDAAARDRDRDRDRIRTPGEMQAQLQAMERLRERVHRAQPGSVEHRRLMREYRSRIQQGMQGLDRMPRPGPDASTEEELRYMRERQRQMDRLMRHMWTYQEQQGGSAD